MTLTVPTTVTGSVLVAVACSQAGYYERSLVTLGHRLPLGWDAAGQRSGGLAGYDLVVAAPRTLSALAWWLMRVDQDHLAQPIHQAHRAAVAAVAVEFTCAIGAESPTVVGHGFDSARQPWSHVHLVYGALAATNHGFTALDPDRVAEQAELHIFGYHLLVRRAVTDLVGAELGLGWAPPAEDGSCEVSGLPTRVLAAIEQPARPLTEIAACWDSREVRDGGSAQAVGRPGRLLRAGGRPRPRRVPVRPWGEPRGVSGRRQHRARQVRDLLGGGVPPAVCLAAP